MKKSAFFGSLVALVPLSPSTHAMADENVLNLECAAEIVGDEGEQYVKVFKIDFDNLQSKGWATTGPVSIKNGETHTISLPATGPNWYRLDFSDLDWDAKLPKLIENWSLKFQISKVYSGDTVHYYELDTRLIDASGRLNADNRFFFTDPSVMNFNMGAIVGKENTQYFNLHCSKLN